MMRFNRLTHNLKAAVTQPLPDLSRPWDKVSLVASEGVKEFNKLEQDVFASHDKAVKQRNQTRRERIAARKALGTHIVDKTSSVAKFGIGTLGVVELVVIGTVAFAGYELFKHPNAIKLLL